MTRLVALVLFGILASAGISSAQDPLEFGEPGPADLRRMYEARVRGEVQAAVAGWKSDWERGDLDELVGRYAGEALLYPAQGGSVRGRRELREYFASRAVESLGSSTLAFGTSGDFAFVVEALSYRSPPGAEAAIQETVLIVFRRDGREGWDIVMQLSRPDVVTRPRLTP